ncbi:C2 domain-containing protein [Caenorhabditis elegans]|uniref:C2 domain-containing protein n=1 Tax=Caenorhabditis elegans TaxID=6239 RepID=A0A679L8R0_CAEEL|nr:C2 domain-containing protein [Caenorhabditis elegans]CAA9991437.1 C2 domain-containing protein [Caenorhabditis elegans]
MSWQSYLVPLVGSAILSTFTFFLGKWDYSFVWVLIIIIASVTKSYLWRKRERRLIALRATALREREVIMAQLQDLPAWVQFPDTERVEWLNKVIHQLWPYVGEYTKTFMNDFIIPQVKAQMPGMFKNFKFTKMDMGDIPCRVGGIKVYTTNVGRDRIIVDMDVAYAGDADFTVSCCGFTGGMNNIQFSGKLRAILKPLLPYPPMVGGVSGTFLEMPKMDFNLTGMGEMVELPGLIDAIRSVINSQIAALCVLPNEIVVPLAPDVDVTQLYFPEPDGVVRLKIIEAKNLENRDISFIKKGKSDPYAEIQVGSQFFKTRTIDDDLNPIWNEYFEAVVDQADGQKLRIELFDEDQGKDEELGRLSVDLKLVQAKGTIDKWYPLEGCKHGDLHIKATWMNLSTELRHLEKQEWEAEWGQADKPIHSALLMVYIDSVADLPYPKSKLEPSPFVEVSLGKETQRTPVKVKTVNPLFQSKFLFFVRHLEGQELKFEAVDDGTRRSLGSLNIPLTTLLKEPNLEQNQQMHMLTLGVHQSPIVITTRIRVLQKTEGDAIKMQELRQEKEEEKLRNNALIQGKPKKGNNSELGHDVLGEYGNAFHIERANGKVNGDVVAVEPAKTVNQDAADDEVEIKLNVDNYQMLRSDSQGSLNSHGRSNSRLGRLFRSKHEMKKRETRADENRGEIEIQIDFDDLVNQLKIALIRCRDLMTFDKKDQCNPYVSVKLVALDGNKEVFKKKTPTAKNTRHPHFDNHVEIDINPSDLLNHKVVINVKDDTNYGTFVAKPVLGCLEIRLDSLMNRQLSQRWIPLSVERK